MNCYIRPVFMIFVCFLAGCTESLLGVIFPGQQDPDDTPLMIYEGHAYLVGELWGDLHEHIHKAVQLEEFDGTGNDAPIIISANAMDDLAEPKIAGIVSAFRACRPIILVNPTADQIVALHDYLFDRRVEFAMPHGLDYAEIYAIDLEEDGHIWQWVQYPPDVIKIFDTVDHRKLRVMALVQWLTVDGERIEDRSVQSLQAILEEREIDDEEDLQVASAFVNTSNFFRYGNIYQLTHIVYAFHAFEHDEEWFYIRQQGSFFAGGTVKSMHSESKGWYMDKIEIDAWMNGYDHRNDSVSLIHSSPETIINVDEVDSSVERLIAADVGVNNRGVDETIVGGVAIVNSMPVHVKGVRVINKSGNRGNNVHWVYDFNRPLSTHYLFNAGLTDPATLAVGTFQPFNQWIWRIQPELRNRNVPMQVKFDVNLCWSTGATDALSRPYVEHQTTSGGSWQYDIYIPYPPNVRK